jgi:hypothetical protein
MAAVPGDARSLDAGAVGCRDEGPHALLASWGIQSQADHCIGMVDVPHDFARPIRVPHLSR